MDINSVGLENGKSIIALLFRYNGKQLLVNLLNTLPAEKAYTVRISYTAKPDELDAQGSPAIGAVKGLYFINPDSAEAAIRAAK